MQSQTQELETNESQAPLPMLSRKQVLKRTGLSLSTLQRRLAKNEFPAPVCFGGKLYRFLETEVDAWIAGRIQQRRTPGFASGDIKQLMPAPLVGNVHQPSVLTLDSLTAEIARVSPDLPVQLDGMGQPMRVADALQWIKENEARALELGRLVQVAADCHVRNPS